MLKDMSKEDKKFLQGVWGKTRYLQYLKAQDEIVKENCKRIRTRRRKIILISALITSVFIFIVTITDFNFGIVWFLSLITLALSCFYEYREEISVI